MSDPGFYAIIPAPVRYCDELTPNAKLLYGEISALCNQNGFCWASNSYFAKLYKVAPTTISEWVHSLKRAGFIRIEMDESKGNERKIFLSMALPVFPKTSSGKAEDPSSGKAEHNNTKKNNTSNEAAPLVLVAEEAGGSKRKKFIPPTQKEVEEYMTSIGLNGSASKEAAKFFNYHEQGGWMMARGKKMVCWKAAARTWKLNWEERNPNQTSKPSTANLPPKDWPIFIGNHPIQRVRDELQNWNGPATPQLSAVKAEFHRWSKTGKYDNEPTPTPK